ncbi:MAG: tyrosine-type recombinase/integrase [Nitrososphaeraceae archaeon]
MQVFEGKLRSTFLNSIGRNSISSQKAYSSGLVHFDRFLNSLPDSLVVGKRLDIETIIPMLQNQQIKVYELLDNFVAYLTQRNISIPSVKLYVAAVRSYLEYNEIDIVFSKFRRRVKMPKHYRDEEQPIDTQDIRKLLLKCNNRRLKAYILLLASSGVRTIEAASLRVQDIDFKESPTKITVRKEFSKTRRARIVYCSDEATEYLQQLLNWKYRNNKETAKSSDLVFSVYFVENAKPKDIYFRLIVEFEKLLISVGDGMDARKDNSRRHKITLHSFRRFCKGIVSDQAGSDYSEWFLGHNYSSYWTRKEQERRNIYAKKCMPYFTILDYSGLDKRSKNIEIAMKEKDQEIVMLKRDMKNMRDEWHALLKEPEKFMEMLQEGRGKSKS